MKKIIQIDHFSKSFGEVKAVQDLSFRVKEGELFAFLGGQRRRQIYYHQYHVRSVSCQRIAVIF